MLLGTHMGCLYLEWNFGVPGGNDNNIKLVNFCA